MVDSRFEDLNGQLEQPFGFVGPTFAIAEQRAIIWEKRKYRCILVKFFRNYSSILQS